MGKITSAEKYFIDKINRGFETINRDFTQEKILTLLGSPMQGDDKFQREIRRALDAIYIKELNGDSRDRTMARYKTNAIKLYKGRETLLRDLVIDWYSSSSMPNILDSIKTLFKG
ncbi:MAG: hypothetical protein RR898_08665 [Clostridium sp.]|uniref:hypothetical protein n=1 Tax=Clostridium sp. TaxID=1506 RepID=UPI002FC7DDE8